eukprot:3196371-Rhodomonas_salina.1
MSSHHGRGIMVRLMLRLRDMIDASNEHVRAKRDMILQCIEEIETNMIDLMQYLPKGYDPWVQLGPTGVLGGIEDAINTDHLIVLRDYQWHIVDHVDKYGCEWDAAETHRYFINVYLRGNADLAKTIRRYL